MNAHKHMNEHMGDERLAELAAGLSTPDPAERAHLEACDACARELHALRSDLAALGHMARTTAPAAPARVHLPEGRASAAPRRRIDPVIRRQRMFAGFTLAAAAAAFLLTLLGRNYDPEPVNFARNEPEIRQVVIVDMEQDAAFMAEVRDLENNPLPSMVTDLIGDADNVVGDEDFFMLMEQSPAGIFEDDEFYMGAAAS